MWNLREVAARDQKLQRTNNLASIPQIPRQVQANRTVQDDPLRTEATGWYRIVARSHRTIQSQSNPSRDNPQPDRPDLQEESSVEGTDRDKDFYKLNLDHQRHIIHWQDWVIVRRAY